MPYTACQYRNDIAAAKMALDQARAAHDAIILEVEQTDLITLDDEDRARIAARYDRISDRIYNAEQDLRAIERRWSMRHWTSQDHQHHALVAANID